MASLPEGQQHDDNKNDDDLPAATAAAELPPSTAVLHHQVNKTSKSKKSVKSVPGSIFVPANDTMDRVAPSPPDDASLDRSCSTPHSVRNEKEGDNVEKDCDSSFKKWIEAEGDDEDKESAATENNNSGSFDKCSVNSNTTYCKKSKWTIVLLVGIFAILCIGVVFVSLVMMRRNGIALGKKGDTSLRPPSVFSSGGDKNNDVDDGGSSSTTTKPSIRPSFRPSYSPTLEPSSNPSSSPSDFPTITPSLSPSTRPSAVPTGSPSQSPTDSPTRPVLPDNYRFRLKMYWRREYNWQEEDEERRWCLECTRCSGGLTSNPDPDNCYDPDNDDGNDCRSNDQLWIQNCNGFNGSSGNPSFEIIRHDDADQIKIYNKNLCVERHGSRFLNLEQCDSTNVDQMFVGFDPNESFDLRPLTRGRDGAERCWSQHHWPKKYEMLYLEECDLAHNWNTGLWEAI